MFLSPPVFLIALQLILTRAASIDSTLRGFDVIHEGEGEAARLGVISYQAPDVMSTITDDSQSMCSTSGR